MRILHIDTGTGWRGGQQQVLWLMEALRARGFEQLLLAAPFSPLGRRMRRLGLPVAELTLPALSLANVQSVRAQRARFDIVHAHDAHAHSLAALASFASFGPRPPLVVSRRVAFPVALLNRLKYRRADAYIVVSHFVRLRLLEAGVPGSKIHVIFDGVPPPSADWSEIPLLRAELRTRHGVPGVPGAHNDGILLGTLTSLAPEKLLEKELDLLAELPPSVHFWMAIPPIERTEGTEATERTESTLREYASSLGLDGRFHIFPIGEDAGPFIASLDIFIYLSRLEGLSSAILLAMSHGLPVLANAVGGIPEFVRHGETGLLADSNPGPELAQFARQLVDSAELRQRLGQAARELVLAHATCDKMAAQTVAVYEELLRQRTDKRTE